MRTITLFCLYCLISIGSIIHLEPMAAIVSVTALSILYLYSMVYNVHPNNRYILRYKMLLREVECQAKHNERSYLCALSRDYPKWFKIDLEARLIMVDDTNPELRNFLDRNSSESIIERGLPMWEAYDYESRRVFLNTIMKELEAQKDRDARI